MLENYFHLVPQIEREIKELKLDSIILGLGPTGQLLPWIDRKVLGDIRVWSAHDAWRLWPVDDLLIMDPPQPPRLQQGTEAFNWVVRARPKRLWIFPEAKFLWGPHLHRPLLSVTQEVNFLVWQRGPHENNIHPQNWPKKPMLEDERPHTALISPTGLTTLAWREGCRRIGVLGMDMQTDHNTHGFAADVDHFFCCIEPEAREKGGLIANLSPISSVAKFRALNPLA